MAVIGYLARLARRAWGQWRRPRLHPCYQPDWLSMQAGVLAIRTGHIQSDTHGVPEAMHEFLSTTVGMKAGTDVWLEGKSKRTVGVMPR